MHPSNKITVENLRSAVFWHRPNREQAGKFERIAQASYDFMKVILENAPDSADRSSALRAAREARMWANAAIALQQPESEIDHERGVS